MSKETEIHKLPDTWILTTLGEIGIVTSGGTPSTIHSEFWRGDIAWITPADLSNYKDKYIEKGVRNITQMGLDNSSAKLLPKGSIMFSSRAPIGYTVIAKNDIATNQGFKNLIITESGYSDYIYYYLIASKQLAESLASGTTFLELSATKFSQIPLPFPPLAEQYRIVEKIEELFSELDKAEESLLNAQKQLEIYRQVVLRDAFDGNLTKQWRKELSYSHQFSFIALKNCCLLITDGTHYSPKSIVNGIPYITVKDINNDLIDFNNSKRISREDYDKLAKEGNNPKINDILFSKDGTVGKVTLIDINKEFAVLSSLAILRPNTIIIEPKYLFYALKSGGFLKQALENKKGVAIRRIVLRDLKELFIKITTIKEQKQVVQEIEYRYTLIENLQKSVEENLKRIEVFRHSILQNAFAGKLIPQDEKDESVNLLLKRINEEKQVYEILQKGNVKNRTKKLVFMESTKTVKEILKVATEPMEAKEVWEKSIHKNNIEKFYEELKQLGEDLIEEREGKISKLSLKNENR